MPFSKAARASRKKKLLPLKKQAKLLKLPLKKLLKKLLQTRNNLQDRGFLKAPGLCP